MAELLGNVYQGDSWNYPGMKDTQILHTNSEDVSSESPSHARVEEQSSLKKLVSADPNMRATQSPVNASLASADRSSPADKPGTNSDAANLQADRHLTISNSSNSSACCMPSLASQAGPSYDINASARTAEQRQHCLPPSEAHYPQHTTAATQQNHMPSVVQPHSRFPDSMVREMMASMFEDVDSGRHRPEDGEPAQLLPSHPIHHRRRIMQQDSILPAYRPFFPQVGPPLMQPEQQQLNHFQPEQQQLNRFQPEQQQLNHFQLQRFEQILPPELLDRPQLHHPQHAQHTQQQHGQDHQEPVQSSFTSFPDVPPFADDAPRQMPSDMRQWPSPAGSTARQARPFAAAQHDLEDLDITGLKQDFSSFTDPATRARQPQPAPRRALSFTQATPASAASSVAAAAASSAGAGGRRGGSMGQAASTSRLSTPGSHVVSPPDTDASLSDSDDASGSDSAGANTKRRKLIKGKRGAGRRGRRMVCKNCGANQTPQWRCGPDGPRTLCNACGVRYKKGLPLTGGATNGSS